MVVVMDMVVLGRRIRGEMVELLWEREGEVGVGTSRRIRRRGD